MIAMDNMDDLLEGLTEEELLALDAEFDPNDDFCSAAERKSEEAKERGFEKRDMVETLEEIIRKNNILSLPPMKPSLHKQSDFGKRKIDTNNNSNYKSNNNNNNDDNNNNSSLKKKNSQTGSEVNQGKSRGYILSEDEDEIFNQLTEEELLELAALTDTHGLLTQEQSQQANGNDLVFKNYYEPVSSPGKRLMSMSDDDADLDAVMLMESLRNDSEEIFHIRINNIKLEKALLHAIFDALKTTKNIKHLSLAGIHLKDEDGLIFNEAIKVNETIETLNLESNELTNLTIEPLCEIFETHPTIREFKCSHQTHGLGSRGEEAMARTLNKNERLLKISYPFKVQSPRSLADRCQIRNNEILRQKRSKGEDFYNYRSEIGKRDAHLQPWIKERDVNKNEKMKSDLADQKGRMKSVGSMGQMRAEAKLRAKENAKPTMDNELAAKLKAAKLSKGRSFKGK